ncbi:MAG: glycosyltransferase [Deltaproteobacteria bacterium]|nr:glycosyltransferase [Deltaproteobacteria bacterium]
MNSAARILILTPTALPSITGNAMTVERWRRGLQGRGWDVEIQATRGLDILALLKIIRQRQPQLIHAHHASHAGSMLLNPLLEVFGSKIPLVVSPGGTDLNVDWKTRKQREIIVRVCHRARFIVVQSEELHFRLQDLLPEIGERLVFIPKSFVYLGQEDFHLREAAGCGSKNLLFFLPAGIRPVKGNLECLGLMKKVHEQRPRIRVLFAGAPIDPGYSEKFEREVNQHRAFARWIPPVPPPAILSAYRAADIILNASSSEGLSNALLEATAAGRPVLASKIPGNRWVVLGNNGDHPMGLLYDGDDPEDFLKKALILIDEEEVRRKFGEAGIRRAAFLPTPEEEAGRLARVYEMAMRPG